MTEAKDRVSFLGYGPSRIGILRAMNSFPRRVRIFRFGETDKDNIM